MQWLQTRTTNPSYPMRKNYTQRLVNGALDSIDYADGAKGYATLGAGALVGGGLLGKISRPIIGKLPSGLQVVGTAGFGLALVYAGAWLGDEYNSEMPADIDIAKFFQGAAVGYAYSALTSILSPALTGTAGTTILTAPNMSGNLMPDMSGYIPAEPMNGYIPNPNPPMAGYLPGPTPLDPHGVGLYSDIPASAIDMSGYATNSYDGESDGGNYGSLG